MSGFEKRLKLASLLEENFIKLFNEYFSDKFVVVKYGIETTKLKNVHEMLRTCHDITAHLVRYIPDSVLVEVKSDSTHRECKTKLIEFKAAETGVRSDSFFEDIKKECSDLPFDRKEDVFNVEKEAFNLYIRLERDLNVPVVIIAFTSYRSDNRLFAQYASEIGICNEYNPNRRGQNQGSGTHLYNVSLKTFKNLEAFLQEDLDLDSSKVVSFVNDLNSNLIRE